MGLGYVPPTVSPIGLTIPLFDAIKQYLLNAFTNIFGTNVYLGIDSADYQDIVVRATMAFDAESAMQEVFLSHNPATAIGTSLDLIGVLIGTARKPASFSTVDLQLTGDPNAIITDGVVKDTVGNFWNLDSFVQLDYSGHATRTATARNIGNITALPQTVSIIVTPTRGWNSVNNQVSATPGSPVEPDSVFRARLMVAQTKPSLTLPAGTAAAISELSGVRRSQVFENPTNALDSNGNPEHSITCVVEGGTQTDIANAIYRNKGIGCYTNGKINGATVVGSTVNVTVIDPINTGITQTINYINLTYLPIYVQMDVHKLQNYSDATTALIEAGIVYYLNHLGIGQPVILSELIGAALTARTDPENPEFSIQATHYGFAAANPTGNITQFTNILSVSLIDNIAPGQLVIGPGIPPGTAVISISSNNVTLTHNASDSATSQPYLFFTLINPPTYPLGTPITVPFYQAAQGDLANVAVTIV